MFFPDGRIHWSARTLENYGFDERKRSFAADDFSLILSDDGTSYKITSQLDPETLVDVTITRTVAGFKIGKDGKTNFGEDLKNPWGCIRHIFWPQAKSEGSITVKGEKFAVDGIAIFIIALQGMKPHHAGTLWDERGSGGFECVLMDE